MENHSRDAAEYQVQLLVAEKATPHTEYAGVGSLKQLWDASGIPELFAQADIQYGAERGAAPEMGLMLTVQPWVRSPSHRRVAQRFGGEPSKEELEADALLTGLLTRHYSQRTVSRFVNTARYDWQGFDAVRVSWLHQHASFTPRRKGVIIVDDFPLPKPYAKEMAYLNPIWDNNLKRKVRGYAIVHLYYYHPHRPGYSLCAEPWLKTARVGETESKGQARRRARPTEERSRLDIACDALEQYQDLVRHAEAVVFDSWYSARWMAHELTQLGLTWIGEAKTNQQFQIGSRLLTVPEIFRCYRTRLRRLKGFAKGVRAVALSATLLGDRYTRDDQEVQLVLVVGLTKKRDNEKGYHLLLTNHLTWSKRHIVRLFSYRPVIEQVHRTGKQLAGWNDFHTRSLPALHCHLALCLLRSTLLTLLACLPVLRDYSLAELIDHGLACTADLRFDPQSHTLQVLVPADALLAPLLTDRLKRSPDSLFTCESTCPTQPGSV